MATLSVPHMLFADTIAMAKETDVFVIRELHKAIAKVGLHK